MEPMPTERRWSEEGLSTVLMVDERAEEAPRAPVDQADVESLVRLVLADPDGLARNAVRSRRACPICHGYSFLDLHGVEHVVRSTEEEASLRERGRLHLLGSDELWLPLNGAREEPAFVVAPSLIVHSILRHGFRPPAVFWRALHAFETGE